VTRFMSLGSFGGAAKQNLLALCLTPVKHMDREKFCEIPLDTTDCPFDWADSGKRYSSSKVTKIGLIFLVEGYSRTKPHFCLCTRWETSELSSPHVPLCRPASPSRSSLFPSPTSGSTPVPSSLHLPSPSGRPVIPTACSPTPRPLPRATD